MKYRKFATTALIAAAATGIAAGTGYAAPADPAPAVQAQPAAQVQGAQQGVDYVVTVAEAGNGIITRVTGGQFGLSADGKSVALRNQDGVVVTQVNLSSEVAGKKVELAAAIDNDARQRTLTPGRAPNMTVKDISSQDWFFSELQHAALGAVIGGIIGFLFVGIGAPFGALIGLLVAGGQPLIDSGSAYFSGQP
ncbi:hypothetical protein GL307_22650 [Nocardia seriolae]|uniref:hypothetical protein n=1 Tax=Nocardia seriolae TaxID=37332 RepID=UPI0012BC515A|nr:hypothetical protein [Nocardia seriolae]MTL14247.1 hypothetical protein [Nocardia seriolae]